MEEAKLCKICSHVTKPLLDEQFGTFIIIATDVSLSS